MYIGKHLCIVDAIELMLEELDEELDISGVSNAEIEAETVRPVIKRTRREFSRIVKGLKAFVYRVDEFRVSPLLYHCRIVGSMV